MGDLVGQFQQREKGKFPATVETNRVLSVEVIFDETGKVKSVLATYTCHLENTVAQVEALEVVEIVLAPALEKTVEVRVEEKEMELVTHSSGIPVEKANAKQNHFTVDSTTPVILKVEKRISDADRFDFVIGIGNSSEVTGIVGIRNFSQLRECFCSLLFSLQLLVAVRNYSSNCE